MFAEFGPNIVILPSQSISPSIVKCILKYKPDVYVKLNTWSKRTEQLNLPRVTSQEVELLNLIPIKKVFHGFHPDWASMVEDWGVPALSLLPAFDNLIYKTRPRTFPAYIGNYSPFKNHDWVARLNQKFDLKVFGRGWFIPECLGPCTHETEEKVFSGLNVVFYDKWEEWGVSERIYKSLGLGGIPLVEFTPASKSLFPDLNYFNSYEEFETVFRKHKENKFAVDTYITRMETLLG
jgi:hypothetical protein